MLIANKLKNQHKLLGQSWRCSGGHFDLMRKGTGFPALSRFSLQI